MPEKNPPKPKILYIEDELVLVKLFELALTQAGYQFLSCDNIKEGISLTTEASPDLVLLDIIIPKPENTLAEQGYDYLTKVKRQKETRDIPVVVFTNLDTPQDRARCRDLGAAAYILKRDTLPREVIEVIRMVISKKRV